MEGVMKTAREALNCKSSSDTKNGGRSTKTPLLNRIYKARSQLMTKITKSVINSDMVHRVDQLIILGAGLDTTYDEYATKVFLVDFPEVLSQRPKSYATLVPSDLCKSKIVLDSLLTSGLVTSDRITVLVECVLAYLPPEAATDLLATLVKALPRITIIMYDPVLSYDKPLLCGFSEKMHKKFSQRDAPLLSCARSATEYSDRLYAAGFAHVATSTINQALQIYLTPQERMEGLSLEPFDEFASLALLQKHYVVALGSSEGTWFQSTMSALLTPMSAVGTSFRLCLLQNRLAASELRLACMERRIVDSTQSKLVMSKDVLVRAANLKDIAALIVIYEQAFGKYTEKYRLVQKYIKFSVKALKNAEKTYSDSSGSVLLVAQTPNSSSSTGSVVVGCLGVKVKPPRGDNSKAMAELTHFCVERSHQGCGIGKLLLAQAVGHCTSVLADKAEICLTVLKDLETARAVYTKAGFETLQTENISDDCELVFMKKII